MNTKQNSFIETYLQILGLDENSAVIYRLLSQNGPSSILRISRFCGLERTKVYRLCEQLCKEGIIEEVVEYKKKLFKAADPNTLQYLITKKQEDIQYITTHFSEFLSVINENQKENPTTKVLFYRGKEGIRQMLWNELSLKGEGYALIYKILEEFVGESFFEKWTDEFALRKCKMKELRTELFDESYEVSAKKLCIHLQGSEVRYIDHKVLPLTYSMSIYNNVTAIYNFWDKEVFGIELYNQDVANLQKLFFLEFWKKSHPQIHTFSDLCVFK